MLTGVPGVGKSTIAGEPTVDEAISVCHFGNTMQDIGVSRGLIKDRRELPKLSVHDRTELQQLAVKEVLTKSRSSALLIDGHLAVESTVGFVAGVPSDCISELDLNAIIVLTAGNTDILARREHHAAKYADYRNSPEHIGMHQDLVRAAAWTYTVLSDASFNVLENPNGEQAETADRLCYLLRLIHAIPS